MPLQSQLLPIQIGGGLDTKTDDKKVISTKLLTLENGIFTQPGKINKRNGYQALTLSIEGGGTITSPQSMKVLGDELVCAGTAVGSANDGKRLFAYSPTLAKWVDKGKYVPSKVTLKNISSDTPAKICGGACVGSYICFAWMNVETTGVSFREIVYTVYDLVSKTFIIPETLISSSADGGLSFTDVDTNVWVSPLGAASFGIYYKNQISHELVVRVVTISGGAVSISGENIIIAAGFFVNFYAIGTATGAAVLTNTAGTTIKLILINTSGTVTSSVTVGTTTQAGAPLSLNFDGTNYWAYWYKPSVWHYAVYSAALSPVLTDTTGNAMTGLDNVVGVSTSGTTQTVYYSVLEPVRKSRYSLFTATVNTSGVVGSATPIMSNMGLSGAPTTIGGKTYLVGSNFYVGSNQTRAGTTGAGGTITPSQPTSFLIDTSDNKVIAKFLPGASGNYLSILASFTTSSTKFAMAYPYFTSAEELVLDSKAATLVEIDFADPDLYQAIETGDQLFWNGGQLIEYDRQPCVELGFHLFPEIDATSVATGSSGDIPNGTYGYTVVYRWFDVDGNLHQSAPSSEVSVNIADGGGFGIVTLTITYLGPTLKQGVRGNVQIGVFRTLNNGVVPHLVNQTDISPIFNNAASSSPTFSFVDNLPDTSIQNNEILYTTGGVIENIAPPAAIQMVNYNNRLWALSSENPNQVLYSKTVSPGVGLSFSDLLTENIDTRRGDVTALASFDDKIVFFKKTVPFFSVGDGANDLGQNSTLSLPLIVPSDVGCSTPKSIIQDMPLGVMFKSDKGIYLMDRSLQVQYIGRDVETYNAQTITSAKLIDSKSQIRFLCSDGVELVYDYIYGQWSTFTNHLGLASDIWQDNYTYVRSDGDIYNETPGVFLDKAAAISLKVGTAWIKLTDIQNFERLRRLFVLGDLKSQHILNGQVYFDYESTVFTTFSFNPQQSVNQGGEDGVYQFRYHMERQKCESARFILFDSFAGLTPGEGYSLSELSIEAGIKQGGVKLSQRKSVG